jgi:hypothetical protein
MASDSLLRCQQTYRFASRPEVELSLAEVFPI